MDPNKRIWQAIHQALVSDHQQEMEYLKSLQTGKPVTVPDDVKNRIDILVHIAKAAQQKENGEQN